ncbi:MAG: hypothetical protein ACQERD_03120 [Campylobacterota bacterium]
MNKSELNEARTNPDFLNYLEETRVKSIEQKDISAMYETLDSMLILGLDEEKMNSLYENILKLAFERVEEIINSNKKLKLQEDELLYVRAFFEHAVEKWSTKNFKGASELVFVLANIIEDEVLEKSLNTILIVLSKQTNLDDFFDNEVDLQKDPTDEKYGYFITNFKFDQDKYLEDNKDTLKKLYKKYQPLLDA